MHVTSCSFFRSLVVPFLLFGLPLVGGGESREAATGWEAQFSAGNGLRLSYDGVPVIRKSTLYLVRPQWTGVLYNQEQVAQQIDREEGETGSRILVTGENESFRAEYRLEAVDETTFRIFFEGHLLRDIPAQIEYSIGYFNANLIAGRQFQAETQDGEIGMGEVASFPDEQGQLENDLAPGFRVLEFDSRIGQMRIEADAGEERILFFDARRDPQGWAREAPVFWSGLGVPSRPVSYDEPVRVEMMITVEPDVEVTERSEEAIAVQPVASEGVQSTRDRPVRLIPQPKSVEWNEEVVFRLTDGAHWAIFEELEDFEVDEHLQRAVRSVVNDLGLEVEGRTVMARAGAQVHFFNRDEPTEARALPGREEGHAWRDNPEGYRLSVNERGVVIEAATQQGAYYGLQTLKQLLRPVEGGGFRVPGVVIEDWPTLSFRGVHWFPSDSGVPFHRKLTERIIGHFKLNYSVIQAEAAEWESEPEIAAPNSISKDDLRGLVELSREHFIEPIPLINVPGHAEWIFRNGENMDIVEDPEVPYAYCVRHPGSDAFITNILSEVMSLFQPRYVHLGHDEVTMRGQFPHPDCPRCGGETATTLVLEHMHRMQEYLAERRVEMMVWGDMMLARDEIPDTAAFAPNVEEAKARRENLPPGLIITDWHYDQGSEYPSIQLFQEQGHPVIGSTWHRPLNIYHFTRAIIEAEEPGLLQTTWAGFFPDEAVLDDALHQFSAFILAADYAWSGREEAPAALPYNAGSVFVENYRRTLEQDRDGFLLDLSGASLVSRARVLELHDDWNLSELPVGEQRLGDVLFAIPEEGLPVVGSRFGPDGTMDALEIGVSVDGVREIALLSAALFGAADGTVAARMIIHYADGETVAEDLVLGRNTAYWGSDSPLGEATVGWQSLTPVSTPINFRISRWQNPRPNEEIALVRIESGDREQALILAGMTFLE